MSCRPAKTRRAAVGARTRRRRLVLNISLPSADAHTQPRQVLDHYIEANRGDAGQRSGLSSRLPPCVYSPCADPFFCSLWPSSIALAENLLKQPKLAVGRRVIDVGCGLGLGGVAAALAGACAVVLADREVLALRCALLTSQANGLAPLPLELGVNGGAGGQQVVRSVLEPASGAAGSGTIGALELDWHAPPAELRGCFDLMTACDVLYEKTAAAPVSALALHLLAPGGTLLLADPPLRTPGNREQFLAALEGKFEAVRTEEQRIFDADGKPVDVRICAFTGKR